MKSVQSQTNGSATASDSRLSEKMEAKVLLRMQSRLLQEVEELLVVSKRTFSSDNRMAVHDLLESIFNLVTRWEAEERLEEGLYRLLDSLKAPIPLRIGEAFAVVIYCMSPHVDQKTRSKWARALRHAAAIKPETESLRKFIRRTGGINACAAGHACDLRSCA